LIRISAENPRKTRQPLQKFLKKFLIVF
jgi:hypothetical protein